MIPKGVLLGVTGGIAAYKAVEILRRLTDSGIRVQVIMTRNAQEFVGPLTFQALSGKEVIVQMYGQNASGEIDHIALRRDYDLLLIAPATANLLGKMAHGIADDFLSTLYLAWNKPILVAPAMNSEMFLHEAVQANIAILAKRGVHFVEPAEGYLACGSIGAGRLADPQIIVRRATALLHADQPLKGIRLLVNAGPTLEDIDPVRFLSNRSSGKMGYALATEAALRGADVQLISGPVSLSEPRGVAVQKVRSAREMRESMVERYAHCDIAILSAAVCDYAPSQTWAQKMKKKDAASPFFLELRPTVDILAELGTLKNRQVLVGFAAETESVRENARKKLLEKRADLIIANDVSQPGIGMESDLNQVSLVFANGDVEGLPVLPKAEVAGRILDAALGLFRQKEA